MKKLVFIVLLAFLGTTSRAQNPSFEVTVPMKLDVQAQPGTPYTVINPLLVELIKLDILAVNNVVAKYPIGVIKDADGKQVWPKP